MRPDFVADVLARLRAAADLEPSAAASLERAIRQTYGGQTLRILPREPVTLEQINAALRTGKPVRVIARELGISRATIYRRLAKTKPPGNP